MTSTSTKARIAGLLYLLLAVFGPFLLIYVPNQLVADGNPAATASNIATHEMLLRFGIASDVVGGVLVLAVALALYWLVSDAPATGRSIASRMRPWRA